MILSRPVSYDQPIEKRLHIMAVRAKMMLKNPQHIFKGWELV